MSEKEVFSKLVSDGDLEKVSGGLSRSDFDSRESFLDSDGKVIWGNGLEEYIPKPKSKDETFEYGGVVWTPTYAHISWRQSNVVWKDGHGNYLVPSKIDHIGGM